jgi:hypothetical protein
MRTLTIQDENASGTILHHLKIELSQEICTVQDLIALRVRADVEAYNQKASDFFQGLVQPNESERTLNGYKMKRRKVIDAEEQVYKAWQAFQQNGFFIIINNRQVENLEEEVWLGEEATASFVKLTPLVGG